MFDLPDDVSSYIDEVFAGCNRHVAGKLSLIPTAHETSLDLSLIEHFSRLAVPVSFPSEWLVRIDAHYVGGSRHYGSWEIADVGLLLIFRRRGVVVRSKVSLLQAKRLYPDEADYVEDPAFFNPLGFNNLFKSDAELATALAARKFTFSDKSQYKALTTEDEQYEAIKSYEAKYSIPVHYLLYNPSNVPSFSVFPLHGPRQEDSQCNVGCRVVPAVVMRAALDATGLRSPSYGFVRQKLGAPFDVAPQVGGWRLETFVTSRLLACKDGYTDESPDYRTMLRIFSQKTLPISAALSITFDMPG